MIVGLVALLIFNYGFQMVRIPPSGIGLPYIEVLLLCCFPFLFTPEIARRILVSKWVTPILIWQLWGGSRVFFDTVGTGFVAIRDGLPILESVFFFVGFALFARREMVNLIVRYLPHLCWVVLVYALCMPFADYLLPITPTLLNMQQQPVPIFFKFVNTGSLLVCCAAYLWVRGLNQDNARPTLPGLFVAVALVLFPSRTLILQIGAILTFFMVLTPSSKRPKRLSLIFTAVIGISGVVLVTASDTEVSGRLGRLRPGDYARLVQEIDWRKKTSGFENLSSGTEERIEWWTDIYNQVMETPKGALLGLGYGKPLMQFIVTGGVVVREPHNTLVSVFGRLGIPGLLIYIWMTIRILQLCVKQLRLRMLSSYLGGLIAFISAFVVASLVAGIGESPFILPFITVPYFFGVGVLACMDSAKGSSTLNSRLTAAN
jgi:hypothetical protein